MQHMFSHDVTAAILVSQNNETILVSQNNETAAMLGTRQYPYGFYRNGNGAIEITVVIVVIIFIIIIIISYTSLKNIFCFNFVSIRYHTQKQRKNTNYLR